MLLQLLAIGLIGRQPAQMVILDLKGKPVAEQVLVESLQGIVNREAAQLWVKTEGIQASILGDMKEKSQTAADCWDALSRFPGAVRGAIEYKLGTHSLNVACSLCGPMHAVAIDESLEEAAKAHGLKILLDTRMLTEPQAYEFYRDQFKRGYVVEQSIDKPANLRDFAIKHNAFLMDTDDRAFRKRVVSEMGPGALVLGWGRDEYQWISDVSAAGGTGVAADWCTNLSALESLPATVKFPAFKPAPNETGVRHVAFVLSDGDNIQWVTGAFATHPNYYGSPLRGSFPMTWEMSPLLSHLAPAVLAKIYSMATPNDDFVTGPGLPGYMFPHPSPDRELLARQTAPYLRDSGMTTISALNQNDGSMEEIFPWLDLPQVGAAIYKDYSPYDRRHGALLWRHGKPCMAYRFILWEGLTGIDDLAQKVAAMPTDVRSAESYALINVHAWSFNGIGGPIAAVQQAIQKLPAGTRVVTANQLFDLLEKNLRKSS